MKILVLLLLMIATSVMCGEVALRATAAKGMLTCGPMKPYEGAKVRLYRINSKDKKEMLDEAESSPAGVFEVNGNTQGRPINETTMVPVVRIYHKCDEDPKKDKGYRQFQVQIPSDYVKTGRKSISHPYSLGTLNLQIDYPGEKRVKQID